MTNKKFKGVIVPAVTPLTNRYEVDTGAVEKMFDNFYAHDISPFILGTTGEAASLSPGQKKDYLLAAARYKKEKMLLYTGISSNSFSESVELAKLCADHAVDAVAATLPSYYALTESQMKKYFEQLADAIPVPLIIYNIPATTHISIPLSLLDELSYHPNIVATKDSERSEERLQRSLELWQHRDDFGHFLGWAAKSAYALLNGSDGIIPSTGNVFPVIYQKMWEAVRTGNEILANEMQQYSDAGGSMYQSGKTLGESLWALKVLMYERGLCQPIVMPPLQPLNEKEVDKLKTQLRNFQF